MRILVLSDSHGRKSALSAVAEACGREGAPDAVIHLGDCIGDARYLRQMIGQPVICVPGNCDYSEEVPERVECIEGARLLICHGHTQRVKHSLLPLTCRAEELEVQAALFGHTHAPMMTYEHGVLLLNPGALMDERCAMMEIEGGEIRAKLMRLDMLC